MRIAIDARMMGPEATRGIGRYIQELVAAMLRIAPEHRFVLITRTPSHPFVDHPSVETIVADIPWYGLKEQLRMPSVLRSAKADIVFIPHWNVPFFYRGPVIVTIHDLLLRHFPSSAKASTLNPIVRSIKRLGYRVILDHAVKTARQILAPSVFTANDIAHFYPSSKSKIVVTGEGMPSVISRAASSELQATPFLLYVGSAYPHKGLDDLFDAWPDISGRHPDLKLKIAGELDVFMRQYESRCKERGKSNIEFLGSVSDSVLSDLYDQALALVFPSHFEGFGLPPLEALAHGCPVLSSDAASLPEVLGKNGVIYFRAGERNAILLAVEKVLENPENARNQAAQAGLELAKRHDWDKTAGKALEALVQAAG